jgi:LuxR family transcriptional regulator, quorum-sensing system regulator CviR
MDRIGKLQQPKVLEIISDCKLCTSVANVHSIVGKAGELFQSEKIIFLTSHRNSPTEPWKIQGMNISYPSNWVNLYISKNYASVDPIINVCRSGLLYWQDVYKELPPQKEFHSQAQEFGLSNGFSHILKCNEGFRLMSIAGGHLRNSKNITVLINSIAPHLHQLVAKNTINKNKSLDFPPLTPREREVLVWAMEGKSNWEISVILKISQETVKGYIANILSKLDAANRTHAVAIALQYNLLIPFG